MTYFVVAAISAFIWLSILVYLAERGSRDVQEWWAMYSFFVLLGSALWPFSYPLAVFVLAVVGTGRGVAKLVSKKENK